mmetsp:Transcript_11959/g.34579  ORF Transcript_11959/g.34579 Transcript_11959/m.34579 type:complete len:959 (+) Transcript_11959:329-3205(+)
MDQAPGDSSSPTAVSSVAMRAMGPIMNIPLVRSAVHRGIGVRTFVDAYLPSVFHAVATSGKFSFPMFLAAYLAFISLWFPFWLLSFLLYENGVYMLFVVAVFAIGRSIIRMIAFPGASHRVESEIEKEFTKYSVRMLVSSANSILDVASALLEASKRSASAENLPAGDHQQQQQNATPPTSSNNATTTTTTTGSSFRYYEIPGLWKRAKSFRDRVLGVYAEVLSYILHENNGATSTSGASTSGKTKYGNNPLVGDVGNLSGLTLQARADGKELLKLLIQVLSELDRLEQQAKPIIESAPGSNPQAVPNAVRMTCTNLMLVASELRDYVTSLRPPSTAEEASARDGSDENLSVDAVRRKFEEQGASTMDAIKSGLSSILPMLDPPLHPSIFGFDVQRGCTLARYQGARQLWIPRPNGGMIDVIHIPAASRSRNDATEAATSSKAVLYCNPNAGLIEVATGMSLAGGNVGGEDEAVNDNCWADFYTNLGYDIYLYNYAGFGRSYGTTWCASKRGGEEPYIPGIYGRLRRIFHGTFLGFRPTPDTLRSDGQTVGTYLVSQLGVENLVIHGESIGGVAASGTAKFLSESSYKSKLSLLICDRTFCNLEAVAQRLVGGWSGYAIRALAPFWSTDVAGDFVAARCRKVVANDCADAIIADSSSLRAGISFWKEIHRGGITTKGVGWMLEAPVQYRMADWENVCVNDSRYAPSTFGRTQSPVWPADKHITLEEAFHFAACVKRIGKMASMQKKQYEAGLVQADEEAGIQSPGGETSLLRIWKILGCCDGMCGSALGMAVRGGFDVNVAWLASTLTYGGQSVAEALELRVAAKTGATIPLQSFPKEPVIPKDFDSRPPGYEQQESESVVHPKPMPEVVEKIKDIAEGSKGDASLEKVKHEIAFCIGTLEYIVARLSSPQQVEASWKNLHLNPDGGIGSFMNLHCGHNNPFSQDERKQLQNLLKQAI